MSGIIHLIVEDENDGKAIRKILEKRRFQVRVRVYQPTGGSGGISRLAKQLEKLVATARANRKRNDCIAVMHDQDDQTQQRHREDYELIARICTEQEVKLVIPRDELESWFLADTGLCTWLGIAPRNRDEQRKPSNELRTLLGARNMKYQGRDRTKVIEKLDGTGDQYSPSMREALRHLENAPCIRN